MKRLKHLLMPFLRDNTFHSRGNLRNLLLFLYVDFFLKRRFSIPALKLPYSSFQLSKQIGLYRPFSCVKFHIFLILLRADLISQPMESSEVDSTITGNDFRFPIDLFQLLIIELMERSLGQALHRPSNKNGGQFASIEEKRNNSVAVNHSKHSSSHFNSLQCSSSFESIDVKINLSINQSTGGHVTLVFDHIVDN